MPVPQTILTRKTKQALFLVLTIDTGGVDTVRDFLGELGSRINSVSSRAPEQALTAIVSIGSDAWDRLFTGPRPRFLHPFVEVAGEVHTAPATPGDLLIHIKSDQADLCYELGRLLMADLGDAVTTVDEVHGFRYFDLRDLIGFVDGTENPVGQAAIDAITVGDEDPAFAGGSYVAVQRYIHDFAAWNALGVTGQENAIGRTKLDNVEMSDEVKPTNSHIALNVVTDADGEEIEIVRDNMPYGDVSGSGEAGTFFIAYSSSPEITETMLRRMFVGEPVGNHDRLLDFTTAVTGAQFFTPTTDFLEDLPAAPAPADDSADEDTATTDTPPAVPIPTRPRPADGSLGIGSLH
ncbi:Dyp-type peroxidase [Gordonia desulfuricans]|uniref:Dyp-type peroxidase n=1 Tax=Gordonia desulfuricans TaxID=89051 RepID=A0A7K3LK36_9ACTN|nr:MULTISPECIES: Dyp-type peroxidase [Gordonia]KOY49968.1 peroxidase [Gordonia sp. NB41Y]NDK88568.1 Dyp-type peroxidase [Gordonia desulfuricans]WLP88840.1 Dyp-type peroxidase [Gordonia sp. NB41Y]